MRANYTANGFTWIPWSSIGGVGNLKRGDILLNEVSHTELYIGNSRNVGAHANYDGVQGDGNGREMWSWAYPEANNQKWTLEPVNDSTGDVNNDSKFNAADAVQLKKFLLGITTLKAPENADLNGDGKINVFDLIAMKRQLIFAK